MTPHFFLSDSTVHVLAQVLWHFLWQGALLGLAAAWLLHVAPVRTANARYVFFCGLLVLLAICPLVIWLGIDTAQVAVAEVPGASATQSGDHAALAEESIAESIAVHAHAPQAAPPQSLVQPPDSRPRATETWFARQRGLIVTTWLAGICLMATRLLLGAIGVYTLGRRCKPIPPELACVVERLSRQLAFRMRPAVHVVERLSQAMAVGIFKPMVLLPASWICELPGEVLEAVIAHELAHLRRWDLPINFVQRVVETLLFFHPAVWWCSRRLRREREMCCDELAQAAIGNRVVYAKALAYLAHQQSSALESLLAAAIGDAKMVLLERIRNVLGIVPGRHGRFYGPSCAFVGSVATSLAWIAVFGWPAPWQSRPSTNVEEVIVTSAESGALPEAAKPELPPDALEQNTPLAEATQAEPLTPENLGTKSHWDLSLEEAVNTAMANAKALRSLGKRYRISAGDHGAQTGEAQQTTAHEGAASARMSVEASLADFEVGLLNLLNDTENAYWELLFAWRNLETVNTALNSARQTWQRIHSRSHVGAKRDEAQEEAQAREQYFQFKTATQTLLDELLRADSRLRYLMGISPTDGRVIRPTDKPTVAKVSFDWQAISEEALARSPDLRRQKWRVKQHELEVIAAKNLLQPRLDSNGKYRWRGPANDMQGQKAGASREDKPASIAGNGTAEKLDGWQLQEFALGMQMTIPIGLRKELATLRCHQLKLARERAKLQEQERDVSHGIADAMRQLELSYQLTQTNMNRALAADRQMEAVQAAFEVETVTIDQLLEAQRRRAEAQTSFFRTLLDYQRAIIAVHRRKGSLL